MARQVQRWLSGLVLGYAAYYLTRNSLTYTAPLMVADPALGFSMAQVGTMTSIFPIAYGTSKLLSGIVGDRFSPSLLLGGGLVATAACNLAFGAGSGLAWFAAMWALNGVMQGVGAPSCARMLTSWFATHERGTYWGLWNVAHNAGGFLSPLLAATAAAAAGWRWGMWAPGLAALILGAYVLAVCRDTPRDAGFNFETQQPPKRHATPADGDGPAHPAGSSTAAATAGTAAPANGGGGAASTGGQAAQGPQGAQSGLWRTAVDNVLSNPYVWALAFTYFCIYVVRQGVTSWTVFYLMNEKGVPDVAQVVAAYTAALAGALAAFQSLPAGAPPLLQWLAVAAIGFCIYGPQMMIGLCGAELVHPASVGASQGVLGWVEYLGAANAGVPLSHIITTFGWHGYFASLIGACGVALLLLFPMTQLRSYSQQQQIDARLAAEGTHGSPAHGSADGAAAARPQLA
ncbi:hypothetical protein GPECTOR_11g167 [Gonium pectorale]|uniref:Major facilitator superfamily (MFS) profile domain-containing protein n=1 Tax=Gonium pectorale TaxID=33097 RepID=A0A150GPF4_GONPE|nr:hypothetical protein GPECTOR_11g167 [Gonium pectorale]|eukprot:KXZ51719.1 hypothetical protein GPECTOR_11g167 [Gonium pectorale]